MWVVEVAVVLSVATMRMDSQVTPPVLVIEKRKAYCGAQFVIPR